MNYLMRKRFGAWVLLLLLLHLLLPASLPELDAPPIEANALQTSQSSPISIIFFQTDPSPVFVGQNFTYKVKVKNSGDEPITIVPLSDERFDPPDSVIIVEDYRPRIFVIPIELHPGEVVEVGPHALFSARRVGEVRITVGVSWSYSGDPGPWYIVSGNFSFMVYESQQETYEIHFFTDPPDVGSITFSGTTYTNGQSGKYAAGTYQIEANVPEGYVFDGWLFYGTQYGGQPPPIEFEDPGSPSTKVIIRGGGTIATIFKWIVRLRGTVTQDSMNEYEIHVRIDELLLDTSGRLRLGEEIWIRNLASNWKPGWVKEGDRVEIYGLGFCMDAPPCQRHGIVIKWPEQHYVRRIEASGVKFRGVVWTEPNTPYDIEVMIDEVLLDPEGRLSSRSLAHVDIAENTSECECDWPLHRGDRVEVYARHYWYGYMGKYAVGVWIYSRDHPYDGYIIRITATTVTRTMTTTITEQQSLPDLTVRDVVFSPQNVVQGGSLTVSWTEANIGGGNAGPYKVGVYLGISEYGRDYLLASLNRDGLAAGGSRSYTQAFTIPSDVPAGSYYVTVFIDDLRAVSETNEDNNIGSSTLNKLTITKSTPITLKKFSYDDKVPDYVALLLEFLGVKEKALSGRLYAELEPIERIARVEAELKLGYVTVDEFKGWVPPSRWETRTFQMRRNDSGFAATFDVSTWWPLNIFPIIHNLLTGGVVKGLISELAEEALLPKIRIKLTGNEPIYLSAEITKITVADIDGNSFQFPVNRKIKTAIEKWFEALPEEEKWMYGMVFSPVALSIVDPQGKRVGYFGGKLYNEIEGAFVSPSDWSFQFILITSPKSGEYKIEVEGLGDGEFHLYTGFVEKGKVVTQTVREKEIITKGAMKTFTLVTTPTPWYVNYWPVFAIAAVAAVAIAFRGRLRTRQRKKLVVRESGKGGELTVINKLSGRRYTLGIFEENTAKDVIDTLIERGLIKPTPEEGYQWALTDRSGSVISPAERLSSRLPEREVFLVARPVGGKRSEDRIELTVIYKRAGKRYTLEVFKDNTAGDVIDALIESGLIKPSPGVGYAWALVSPRLLEIPYDEKILSALSPGENEVFLVMKPGGGLDGY